MVTLNDALSTGVQLNDLEAFDHLRSIFSSFSDEHPLPQHVLRYRHYWNDKNHIGRLDELLEAAESTSDLLENAVSTTPNQLLNLLEEKSKYMQVGPDAHFEYLDRLPDHGRMRILRTKYEIVEAGKRLHNCIGRREMGYISKVERRRSVLVCLLDEARKKPIAVGEHPLGGEWSPQGWMAIYETRNKSPSQEAVAAFHDYTKHFRRWHRNVFVPERKRELAERRGSFY